MDKGDHKREYALPWYHRYEVPSSRCRILRPKNNQIQAERVERVIRQIPPGATSRLILLIRESAGSGRSSALVLAPAPVGSGGAIQPRPLPHLLKHLRLGVRTRTAKRQQNNPIPLRLRKPEQKNLMCFLRNNRNMNLEFLTPELHTLKIITA